MGSAGRLHLDVIGARCPDGYRQHDLSMPGVDGIEMLRTIKRNQQLADMQIVVISGMPVEAIAARGGLPPQARLVQKPVNFDWLHGYVTALVMANAKWR